MEFSYDKVLRLYNLTYSLKGIMSFLLKYESTTSFCTPSFKILLSVSLQSVLLWKYTG